MKFLSFFKEGKALDGMLVLTGILSAAAIIIAALGAEKLGGDIIYPAVEASQRFYVIETEDGSFYYQNDITAQEIYEDEGKTEFSLVVNINEATLEELMLLPGIGEVRAKAIIEYREITGGFGAVEELCEVKGIGEKLYEQISPYCTVEGPRVQSAED